MMSLTAAVSRLCSHDDADVRSLARCHTLRGGLVDRMLDHLGFAPGTRGLDLGCGIGLTTLAAAARPGLSVTGIDRRDDVIREARRLSGATGLDRRADFCRGDILVPGIGDNSIDWALSVDCMGYMPGTARSGARAVHRILVPGGTIALAAWSSQMLLPGYPRLEALLNSTAMGIAPFESQSPPDSHFLYTAKALAAAGFSDIRIATFVQDIAGPLKGGRLAAVRDLAAMRWGERPVGLAPADSKVYARITRGNTPVFTDPGWHGFFSYTLFTGVKS